MYARPIKGSVLEPNDLGPIRKDMVLLHVIQTSMLYRDGFREGCSITGALDREKNEPKK